MSQPRMHDPELLEELSAFMDGELDADRSRFLLQRLAHDEVLRARWERWQLQSGALRKMAQPLPAGFAAKVAQAVEAQAGLPAAGPSIWRRRRTRWIGAAAMAAALGVAGVFTFDLSHAPRHALPQVAVVHPATPQPSATTPATPTQTASLVAAADAPATRAVAATTPVRRTVAPQPEPSIRLPIPVRAGVVSTFHLPLHPRLQRNQPALPGGFQPFPQPYAIDPELAAYLQDRQSGKTHDVFSEDAQRSGNSAVRTVSWPQEP